MVVQKKSDILLELKDTISDLISDLKQVFNTKTERGELALVEFFYKKLHHQRIYDKVKDLLLPHSKYIKERDLEFFEKNTILFSDLPDDRVEYYKRQILSDRFDDDDINMIWEYLDTIVALSELYLKT